MDKVMLRKWLKAGYMERNVLHPTEAGTPQGGICSPVIANLVLDGLEALKPTKRITVRISPVDLQTLQQKAQALGLPYQTLLKSVIHQYLTGQLVPRP